MLSGNGREEMPLVSRPRWMSGRDQENARTRRQESPGIRSGSVRQPDARDLCGTRSGTRAVCDGSPERREFGGAAPALLRNPLPPLILNVLEFLIQGEYDPYDMAGPQRMDVESLRISYRPEEVHLLLVGESAPASGRFFYHKSPMTTFTRRAFEKAYGITFEDNQAFLRFLQSCGCYLEDLSLTPVNTMPAQERAQTLQASVSALAQRIRDAEPAVVVAVLRRIERYVREALERVGRPVVFRVLPFAGNHFQNQYIDGLSGILRQHLPRKP